jgi:ABC-2 type transport system ATP-binding protein
VGYLPAEFTLEAGMTGDCLVRFWARLRGVKCDYGLMLAKRLTADLQHPVQRLSRGQKQKIGIVQALLHQPQVLILDEPTSGLDPLAREELFRMMREVKARGRTVFFSSHILSEVEKLCDRVAIIRAGTLVALEDIGTLRGRHTWKIHSVFARTPDIEALARLAEVSAIAVQGEEVTLRVSGDLASVLRWCAGYPLVDFTCEHPDLEEVFMRFYGEEQ